MPSSRLGRSHGRFKVDPHKQDYVVPLSPQLVEVLREQIAELESIYGVGVDYIWPSSMRGTRKSRTDEFVDQ